LTQPDIFKLYAVRYAHNAHRKSGHSFLVKSAPGDPHDGPMPMDYFVWGAVSENRTVVVDMGFTEETARKRKHEFFRCPADGLRLVGIDPSAVDDVVITHMHWDHVGNFDKFPNALFHIQEEEHRYVTGRDVHWKGFKTGVSADDVCDLVRTTFKERVVYHDGSAEIGPGVSIHFVGGHTRGQQIARIHTRRGWVVVASDAAHYYANMRQRNPFPAVYNVGDNLLSFDTAARLAASPDHVIPGHDPLVMRYYPAPSPELEGIAVRLDVDPRPIAPKGQSDAEIDSLSAGQ
jgi:glyoxylase-like metal-dependent hydrolase (beta-lactamase superfamily II)